VKNNGVVIGLPVWTRTSDIGLTAHRPQGSYGRNSSIYNISLHLRWVHVLRLSEITRHEIVTGGGNR